MNKIKTGGGAPEYIPPDDILDHVSSLLGSTVNGFTVEFGGDAEPAEFIKDNDTKALHVHDEVGIEGGQVEVPALSIDSKTFSIDNADVVMEPILVVEQGGGSTLAHTPDKP
ncbi:unnamed protein product, partial [Brenthis ino]